MNWILVVGVPPEADSSNRHSEPRSDCLEGDAANEKSKDLLVAIRLRVDSRA